MFPLRERMGSVGGESGPRRAAFPPIDPAGPGAVVRARGECMQAVVSPDIGSEPLSRYALLWSALLIVFLEIIGKAGRSRGNRWIAATPPHTRPPPQNRGPGYGNALAPDGKIQRPGTEPAFHPPCSLAVGKPRSRPVREGRLCEPRTGRAGARAGECTACVSPATLPTASLSGARRHLIKLTGSPEQGKRLRCGRFQPPGG